MIKEYFKRNSPIFYIGVITAVVFVFIIIAGQTVPNPSVPMEVLSENVLYGPSNPVIGSPEARVTLVEFMDYNCPACSYIAPALKEYVNNSNGRVKLIVRHLPLPIAGHETSVVSAEAATASNKFGKFAEYHQGVFSIPNKTRENLIDLAVTLGIPKEDFIKELDSEETKKIVSEDTTLAGSLKIQGTPTIFINGKLHDTKKDLGEAIAEEVARMYPETNTPAESQEAN